MIREDPSGEIYSAGLKEEPISCSEDIFDLFLKKELSVELLVVLI